MTGSPMRDTRPGIVEAINGPVDVDPPVLIGCCNVTVNGSPVPVLTIQPGVTVKFNSATSLTATTNGSLQAVGTSGSLITFTANGSTVTFSAFGNGQNVDQRGQTFATVVSSARHST